MGHARAVHRALAPPRPDLFGDERKVRREETQQRVERERERGLRRPRRLGAHRAVGALLHQLEVVVAETPEEPFGVLERAGVVVGVERVRRFVDQLAQEVEQRLVDRHGDRAGRGDAVVAHDTEHELRRVEDLDRQPAPDLHLAFVERGVGARARAHCPVTHRIGPVLLEQRHRRDDVALALRHLLAVGVEDPAVDGGVGPRQDAVLEVRAHDGVEEPGADDLRALRPKVHGERAREEIGIDLPAARDLRGQRRRGPRVHHVGITDEPARLRRAAPR